jgi:predicted ArsR family transcriptional regulator
VDSFEDALEAFGCLADDNRRRMYLFIREKGRPVGRDEAAETIGISRKLAAFHLDKLVEKGLLKAHYVRLSDKRGPGAGRPSKVYEPTGSEMAVSIPSRSYDVAAKILIEAIQHAGPRSATVPESAREEGFELGHRVRTDRRLRSPGDKRTLELSQEILYDRGYEPYRDQQGDVRLRNCPFHELAQQSVEIVCGLNQAFIDGFLKGLGNESVKAVLDPQPGQCCVRLHRSEAVR